MIVPLQGSYHLSMLILLVNSILDSLAPNLALKVPHFLPTGSTMSYNDNLSGIDKGSPRNGSGLYESVTWGVFGW